jgi:hypothetical protein
LANVELGISAGAFPTPLAAGAAWRTEDYWREVSAGQNDGRQGFDVKCAWRSAGRQIITVIERDLADTHLVSVISMGQSKAIMGRCERRL